MKKRKVLVSGKGSFLLILFTLSAQFVFSQNWNWGVSVNPEISTITWTKRWISQVGENVSKPFPLPGFHAGLEFSRRKNSNFAFSTGILFGLIRYGNQYRIIENNPAGYSDLTDISAFGMICFSAGVRYETQKGFYAILRPQLSPGIFTSVQITNDLDESIREKYFYSFDRLFINYGFHTEAGYRFKSKASTFYIGPTFSGNFKSFFFLIWSPGIKISWFFRSIDK